MRPQDVYKRQCLDKTGTLTEGYMEVVDTMPLVEEYGQRIPQALTALTQAIPDHNATFKAIAAKYPGGEEAAWVCTCLLYPSRPRSARIT